MVVVVVVVVVTMEEEVEEEVQEEVQGEQGEQVEQVEEQEVVVEEGRIQEMMKTIITGTLVPHYFKSFSYIYIYHDTE